MALSVRPAIPASQITSVIPSVLSAGGSALDLIGIMLDSGSRAPIDEILEFVDASEVEDYFGAASDNAKLGDIYFLGFDNSAVKPGKLLWAQYPRSAVGAWLRGGNMTGTSVATLQGYSGELTVQIDAAPVTATIDLSAATSFSNAAVIIANALAIHGPQDASVTASLNTGNAGITGSISGTVLTVTAVGSGALYVGSVLAGSGISGGITVLSQLSGTTGGTGTYRLSGSQSITSEAITGSLGSGVLHVTSVVNGTLNIGDTLSGTGITAGTYITGQLDGTIGGVGNYTTSAALTIGSEAVLVYKPGVFYDSIAAAFQINSASTGVASTIDFATGALATSLRLTEALGAVTSQGSAIADPATFLNNIIKQTQDWVSFTTTFEPSDSEKEAFALWTNVHLNRYLYCMWDTDIVNTEASGPSAPVALITTGDYSGICMIHEESTIDTVPGELAAFVMGAVASIDYTRTEGRATLAFKKQSGLAPQIFDADAASYLQSYGLNLYGDYTTANDAFTFFYPGSVSGDFKWLDSYVDQIWLNNQFQLALMVLLTNVNSIPYNHAGYAMIEAALLDPIVQALDVGVIRAGVTLSAAQKVEINTAAGADVASTVGTRGWYLQIKDAVPQVRIARTSPPITFWYTDGQSVQKLNLQSVEVQ